ncbi:hypothetical protein C1645_745531 [Glomus cerebriforme]|uniref:Uncharacterized protein n=1 Tax=Glomus cerebriforme TaxID=658196 RepID=A0A397S7P2_9GLOM|nr:hypothetical protein C1645_745531 [Glomus cerebriforme]
MVICDSDITQPNEKYGPDQFYFGFYQPSQDDLFNKLDYPLLKNIIISFGIIDNNYKAGANQPEMFAFDSEYTLSEIIKEKKLFENTKPEYFESTSQISQFIDSIVGMNGYFLHLNQSYQFSYSRLIKEFIEPSWINDFGIPPTYEQIPYITSKLVATSNPSNINMLIIVINPTSSVVQVDREYLGGLGLMGGAWGLATAIYELLFGTDTLRPWGIIQSYCCGFSRLTRDELKKTLPTIPFFDKSYSDTKNQNDLSLTELQSRIKSLELFLQEYVVDVNYLSRIDQSNMTSDDLNNREIHNLNTNSTISIEDMQQRQEITIMPPNFTQDSDSNSTTSGTKNNLYNDDPEQQIIKN